MRLITRQYLANIAAKHWMKLYGDGKYGLDKVDIGNALIELCPNPLPDDVDSIIGNASWTRTKCDECGVINTDVVEIGEELGYDSSTAQICKGCLNKALEL